MLYMEVICKVRNSYHGTVKWGNTVIEWRTADV